jgi:hypothetical protein
MPCTASLSQSQALSSPCKEEGVSPCRPTPPAATSKEEGRTLNPLEKRRQMVVSHLAAANPGRLARNRKLVLEKTAHRTALIASSVGLEKHPASPSASSANHSLDDSREVTDQDTNIVALQPRPPPSTPGEGPQQVTPRRRPSSGSHRHTTVAAAGVADLDDSVIPPLRKNSPMDGDVHIPVSNISSSSSVPESTLHRPLESLPSSPPRGQPSPRRPLLAPASNAPMPGCSGRQPPADLLLKEDFLDVDPLEHPRPAGAGLSMAPPCSGGYRPGSAGLRMAPLAPDASATGEAWRSNFSGSSMDLSMSRKMMATPPTTASTTAPLCETPDSFF